MSTIIQPIVIADEIEEQVTERLRTWLPTYLEEIRLQRGDDQTLPAPRSYNVRGEFDKWPEDQLPSALVISAGISDPPEKSGDGWYDAPWRIGIALVAASTSMSGVNRNIRVYAGAIRALILQKRFDLATHVTWVSESYDEGPVDGARTFGSCIVEFTCMIGQVVNTLAGPAVPVPPDPDTIPGSEWPDVEQTFVQVTSPVEGG